MSGFNVGLEKMSIRGRSALSPGLAMGEAAETLRLGRFAPSLRAFSRPMARHERAFGSPEAREGESNGGGGGSRIRNSAFF